MPVYAYECTECGVRFDRKQSFSDDPVTVCPECEGVVHRLIQPAGVIFKGSGFYVNDSKGSRKTLTSPAKDGAKDSKEVKDSKESKATTSSSSDKSTGSNGGSSSKD